MSRHYRSDGLSSCHDSDEKISVEVRHELLGPLVFKISLMWISRGARGEQQVHMANHQVLAHWPQTALSFPAPCFLLLVCSEHLSVCCGTHPTFRGLLLLFLLPEARSAITSVLLSSNFTMCCAILFIGLPTLGWVLEPCFLSGSQCAHHNCTSAGSVWTSVGPQLIGGVKIS